MRSNRWVGGTAVLVALVASVPIDAVAKPKETIIGVVNGHRLRFKNKQIDPGSNIVGAGGIDITASTKPHRLGQTVKSLVVTCAAGPLAGGTVPGPGEVCTIAYMETKLSRNPTAKEWSTAPGGGAVTFTSFADGRVQGTFQGTLPALFGTTGSITANGTFSILLP